MKEGIAKKEMARRTGLSVPTVRKYLKVIEGEQPAKQTKVRLYMEVRNNSKFVRGKTRSRRETEEYVLHRYQMKKQDADGWEYLLTIPHETEEELDRIIYDGILGEASRIAESRNGFIKADVYALDGSERSW